jgi:hypothetical protein
MCRPQGSGGNKQPTTTTDVCLLLAFVGQVKGWSNTTHSANLFGYIIISAENGWQLKTLYDAIDRVKWRHIFTAKYIKSRVCGSFTSQPLLPNASIALLHYCVIALLRYCITALLHYCIIVEVVRLHVLPCTAPEETNFPRFLSLIYFDATICTATTVQQCTTHASLHSMNHYY